MIEHVIPWVQCFSCHSHGLDVWVETLFKNTFETAWKIVQSVVSHQNPLTPFHKIATLPVFEEIGTIDPLKYVDTRYGSRVLMGRCLLATRRIYRNLMVDTEMEA